MIALALAEASLEGLEKRDLESGGFFPFMLAAHTADFSESSVHKKMQ